ncbi:hypothetical protein GCM10027053_51390 [Intrasporangium mesophilum]
MRWDRLFDDLEAVAAAERSRERDGEVADRTRRERGQLDLQSRMLANLGNDAVSCRLHAGSVSGRLVDVGPDWALLESRGRSVVVALAAVRALTGLASGARIPTVVARSFSLAVVLRGVSRDRSRVEVVDLEGRSLVGTIDSVGADHIELVIHAADVPRRHEHLAGRVVVPLWSLGSVRRL